MLLSTDTIKYHYSNRQGPNSFTRRTLRYVTKTVQLALAKYSIQSLSGQLHRLYLKISHTSQNIGDIVSRPFGSDSVRRAAGETGRRVSPLVTRTERRHLCVSPAPGDRTSERSRVRVTPSEALFHQLSARLMAFSLRFSYTPLTLHKCPVSCRTNATT